MASNLTTVNGAALPPGTYFFSPITETDHAGYVWIVAILSLIYPFGTLMVRMNVRRKSYGADDWALLAATLVAVCQHIPIFVGLRSKFGQSSEILNQTNISTIEKALYAAEIFFILAYTLSKVSLALFVGRLFTLNKTLNIVLCSFLVGIIVAWGVVALFVLLINCSPHHFFATTTEDCPAYFTRWQAVTVFDIVTEVALIVIPTYLVSGILIGLRPKMIVVSAFSFRLVVLGFSIAHLRHISEVAVAPDRGLSFVAPAIWIQIWLAWSLVSASIPSFRAFINPFDKIEVTRQDDSYNASRSEVNGAYLMMGPLPKSGHRSHVVSVRSENQGNTGMVGRASGHHQESRDENQSMESWHSQTGIIRKDVEWEIRRDREPS